MNFEIYHQAGFRHQWNLQSIEGDGTGDGIIIGARSIEREKVEALPQSVRVRAFFDPQFFLPSVAKGHLESYNFFPQLTADGFKSSDYAEESALLSATQCVAFQAKNDFRFMIIPTRFMPGMPSNYIEAQTELFVGPFLGAIRETGSTKPVLLQVVLTENMLKDDEYSSDLLNWITGLADIAGIYLIVEPPGTSKQVKDADLLYRTLRFIHALRENDMIVALGYLNTESIMLAVADPSIVTMGIYENTRSFRIKTFEENESQQRGPSPRLYCSKLLQWIDRNYHGAMQRRLKDGASLFDQNQYQATMFEPTYKWHFAKAELYKHHFLEMNKQLRSLSILEGKERFEAVRALISEAAGRFRALDKAGVVLDQESDGSHLAPWLTALNEFAQDRGW